MPCCTPIPLDRLLGNLESGVTGTLVGCRGGSQGLGICKREAGGGAGHVGRGSVHSRLRSSSPSGRLPSLSCNRWEDNCPCTIIDLWLGGLSGGLPCVRGASRSSTLTPFSQTSLEFGSINCYQQGSSFKPGSLVKDSTCPGAAGMAGLRLAAGASAA